MLVLHVEDAPHILQSLMKSERPDVKLFYLEGFGPSPDTAFDREDPFQLLPDAARGDVPWAISRLLHIGRVVSCDERALWERLGSRMWTLFARCDDLWTEQKAVKWVRAFLEYRYGGMTDTLRASALWTALEAHVGETIKPLPTTQSVRDLSSVTSQGRSDAPPDDPLVPDAVEIVPMLGLSEGLIRCKRPLPAFQELLRVPRSALFCCDTVVAYSQLGRAIDCTPGLSDIRCHEETLLVLCLIYERDVVGPSASHWSALLAGCPETYPLVPSFWELQDLAELEGLDMLDEILERRAELEAFRERVLLATPVLCTALRMSAASKRTADRTVTLESLQEVFSLEALQWARATFDSRAFYLNIDSKTALALAPFADMINHSNRSDVLVRRVEESGGDFVMEVGAALGVEDVGRELWMSYGPLQNWELLQYYGFVLPDNAHDTLPFPFALGGAAEASAVEEVVAGATNAEWELRRQAVAKRYFLHELGRCWVRQNGIPCDALLALLRLQFATAEELLRLLDGVVNPFTMLSLETEHAVCEAVEQTIECMLQLFPTTLEEDHALLKALNEDSVSKDEEMTAEELMESRCSEERYRMCLKLRCELKSIAGRVLSWCEAYRAEISP